MLACAAEQDYLLMLYDEGWDPRMESAVLFLAARVQCPVIVYGGSWSGRMVKEFSCGLLACDEREKITAFLQSVPRPGTLEYTKLLEGISAFREAHSVASLRAKVVSELFSD